MRHASFQCPHCHREFTSRASVAGKTVRCLKCGTAFIACAVEPSPAPQPPVPSKWEKRVPLLVCVPIFLGGLLACYWGIGEPLEEMERRVPEVKYSIEGLSSGPLLLLLSLVLPFIIASDRNDHAEGYLPRDNVSRMGKVILTVVTFGAVFGTSQWFEQKAESLGYRKGSLLPPPVASPAPAPVPKPFPPFDPPSWRPKGTGVSEDILQEYLKKLRGLERELNKATGPAKPPPRDETPPVRERSRE